MRKNWVLLLFVISFFFFGSFLSLDASASSSPRIGVWITVFSPEEVLHKTQNVDQFIEICKRSGVTDVYLQIYRANKAYYDSRITDKTFFDRVFASTGQDVLKYLLAEANKNDIKVHAWINLLSIAHNKDASILKKYGNDVLAFDQYGRPSMAMNGKDELDEYYIRENQLFLEPGDKRVRKYLTAIAKEIIKKYPGFSGLHLDYIRYPIVVPFVPGARFTSHGISYGYSSRNTKAFKKAEGLDVKKMAHSRENFLAWDEWRRKQVSTLLSDISKKVRRIDPTLEISCAIAPSMDRTYLTTFQDWTKWLEDKTADHVVAMNYTDDSRLMELQTDSMLLPDFSGKVHIGLGAYLLKNDSKKLENQLKYLKKVSPGGIVLFSYDNLARNPRLQKFLKNNFM